MGRHKVIQVKNEMLTSACLRMSAMPMRLGGDPTGVPMPPMEAL